jgi:hypothetical protein
MRVRPQLPDYGMFTHWPGEGHQHVHPEDIAVVSRVVPSGRVFRRFHFDGVFYHYQYGSQIAFRLRPSMWVPLRWEGIDVGDQVEVTGLAMARDLFVARVVEMRFSKKSQRIEYTLDQAGVIQPRRYTAEQLRNLDARPQLRRPD